MIIFFGLILKGEQHQKANTDQYKTIGQIEGGPAGRPNTDIQKIGYPAVDDSIDKIADSPAQQ